MWVWEMPGGKENKGIASKTALGIKEEMKTQKIKSTEVGGT